MLTSKASMGASKQATIIEVNASAKPSEVVAAVLRGADAPRSSVAAGNRMMQGAFAFVIVFAVIVYFREEIWSMSRDVSKHPIMGYTEQLQIRQYLGTQWLFGSGKDITSEDVEVARLSEETAVLEKISNITSGNTTGAAAPKPTTETPAKGTEAATPATAAGEAAKAAMPGEAKPAEAQAAQAQPAESKTAEAAGQVKAGDGKAADSKPAEAKPALRRQQRKLLAWGRVGSAAMLRMI